MTEKETARRNRNYLKYVNSFAPPTKHFATCGRAFLVGGFICCIGQFFRFLLEIAGLTGDVLAGTVSVLLIFLGTLLTGLGVYDRIGNRRARGASSPLRALPIPSRLPPSSSRQRVTSTAWRPRCSSSRGPSWCLGSRRAPLWGLFIICWVLGEKHSSAEYFVAFTRICGHLPFRKLPCCLRRLLVSAATAFQTIDFVCSEKPEEMSCKTAAPVV